MRKLSGILIIILSLGSGLVYYVYKNSASKLGQLTPSPTPAPTPLPTSTPLIKLKELPVTISRLAFGMPVGSLLEFADGGSLAQALAYRRFL